MKTIAYIDKVENKTLHCYKLNDSQLFRKTLLYPKQKRLSRIVEALRELRHTGNIDVYLINGSKYRKILSKGI